jgi:hypothetical protein
MEATAITSHNRVSSLSRTDRLLKKFMDMSGEIKIEQSLIIRV